MRRKEITATTRVLEALVRADDFCTARQLQQELALDCNHVSAALHHLRKYKAVDCLEGEIGGGYGTLWWFATPERDCRSRVVHERTPEPRPRKPRRAARKKEVK